MEDWRYNLFIHPRFKTFVTLNELFNIAKLI